MMSHDEIDPSPRREIRLGLFVSVRQVWDSIKQTVFIIGSALILFTAARNTITWHLQGIWGASGDFWQRQFQYVYDYCDGDPFLLGFVATMLIVNIFFWGFNAFWIVLDTTGRPQSLLKYKIQPKQNMPVNIAKFTNAVKVVLFNQEVVTTLYGIVLYWALRCRGAQFGRDLPHFYWVLFEFMIFSLVEEISFYYSHRLLHHPKLYQRIHKIHHEWTSPIGINSLYCHPIEHIISNLMGPTLGPLIMGSHVATVWLWLCLALFSTTIAHCGYHFPFLPSPEAHDFHHQKFINNFGVLGILDRLHGTDNLFRQSKAFQRHIFSTSLTPVAVMFPDEPAKGSKAQ